MNKITYTKDFDNIEEAQRFLDHASTYVESKASPEPSTAETPAPTEETPTADGAPTPIKGRRRGRPAKKDEEKPEPRRRSRAKKDEEKPAEAPATGTPKISDADLVKAASEAAKELGVDTVLKELHAYKVEKVHELEEPARDQFVQRLRQLLNVKEAADKTKPSTDAPAW